MLQVLRGSFPLLWAGCWGQPAWTVPISKTRISLGLFLVRDTFLGDHMMCSVDNRLSSNCLCFDTLVTNNPPIPKSF